MNDNEFALLMGKRIILGCLALALLGAGTCTYVNHDDDVTLVEVERHKAMAEEQKAEAEKAARDRAMFDGMNRPHLNEH